MVIPQGLCLGCYILACVFIGRDGYDFEGEWPPTSIGLCCALIVFLQNLPSEFKGKTTTQKIEILLLPPAHALVTTIASTYSIEFLASCLYVCFASFTIFVAI